MTKHERSSNDRRTKQDVWYCCQRASFAEAVAAGPYPFKVCIHERMSNISLRASIHKNRNTVRGFKSFGASIAHAG
jgi:hypothetical protein